jgi:hypothetical protein
VIFSEVGRHAFMRDAAIARSCHHFLIPYRSLSIVRRRSSDRPIPPTCAALHPNSETS